LDIIKQSFKDLDNERILDYGCNTGYFLNSIQKTYPEKHLSLCGADINPHALNYARKKYKNCTFFEITNDFFSKEQFDIIILSHVLEHVADTNSLIEGLKRLLKNNGKLIIAVPQERIRGDCTIVQLLYNWIRWRFENPHLVNYSYTDLEKLLNEHQLYIKHHRFTHFFYPFQSNKRRLDSWSLVVFCGQKIQKVLKSKIMS